MEKINAVITGVGGYVPKYILDNDEMSRIVDTTDEWIMERIGVKTRHILRDEERQGAGTSYLMTKAVEELMAKTQVDPDTIEAVICATTTPDYHFPSTASLVIGNLGFKHAFGFDMEAACAGFLYAMEVGASMITSGRRKRIIVCGGDFMSSMTNYMDRTTCPIFGDGAACVMMEATTEDYGLIESFLRTDSHFEPLHMAAGGSAKMPSHETVETAVARRIGVPAEKVMINIDHMANTSGGTLPLCLWEYEPKLKRGDNLIFTAFGAGFTWGASYMKWAYDGSKYSK